MGGSVGGRAAKTIVGIYMMLCYYGDEKFCFKAWKDYHFSLYTAQDSFQCHYLNTQVTILKLMVFVFFFFSNSISWNQKEYSLFSWEFTTKWYDLVGRGKLCKFRFMFEEFMLCKKGVFIFNRYGVSWFIAWSIWRWLH